MQRPSSLPPMAVALSYFHKIIGPSTIYVHPAGTVTDVIVKEVTNVIDKVTSPGFFTQSSDDYTAIIDFFEVPSAWARGAKELVLVSFIFPGKVTPDVELVLQPLARNFECQVLETAEIYKGFYKADEGKYPESGRAAIQEMHQKLVSHVIHLHVTANEALLETWMLKKSEELLPDSIVNNPVLSAVCNSKGLDILTAVSRGAKTRLEVANLSGLGLTMIGMRLPTLIGLDLLTEGTELVLTNRGLKVLAHYSVKDLPEGARTCEDLQTALQNNSQLPPPQGLKSYLRYLVGMELLERGH